MAAGLTACGSAPNAGSTAAGSSVEETADTDSREDTLSTSVPEDIDTEGIDADAGASVVVRDGQVLGNLEYMAGIIQEVTGGDLFRIETVEAYPLDHESLVDQAAEEQDADARPALSSHIENLDQYDTVFIGYPNWWADLPQPLYTFFDEYDFSGTVERCVFQHDCDNRGTGAGGQRWWKTVLRSMKEMFRMRPAMWLHGWKSWGINL